MCDDIDDDDLENEDNEFDDHEDEEDEEIFDDNEATIQAMSAEIIVLEGKLKEIEECVESLEIDYLLESNGTLESSSSMSDRIRFLVRNARKH